MNKVKNIDPHFNENSYLVNKEKFKNYAKETILENTGFPFDEIKQSFTVKVFNDEYLVYWPSGDITKTNGEEVNSYSLKILLMRYMMCAEGKKMTKNYVGYKELPDGHMYYQNFYIRCIKIFAQYFDNRPEALKAYMESIGGLPFSKGDAAYYFTVMKGIDMGCILWFSDEEFEPEAQILFDDSISGVMGPKDLAILGDVFIANIKSFKPSI